MHDRRYCVFAGEFKAPATHMQPAEMDDPVVYMGRDAIPGSIFTTGNWYRGDVTMDGLVSHPSGEILMLIGGKQSDPAPLFGEFEIQIGNDVLTFTETSCIYIPAGVAHGNIKVRNVEKPFFYVSCQSNSDIYEEEPAEPVDPVGTYVNYYTDLRHYDPTGVEEPPVGEDIKTRMFYIDDKRVPGAPYTEAVWWNIPTPRFLDAHTHEIDELVAFWGGDPETPEDLRGEIDFYVDGEPIKMEKSGILFIPAGIYHTPFDINRMDVPCQHFSGGNASNYHRAV